MNGPTLGLVVYLLLDAFFFSRYVRFPPQDHLLGESGGNFPLAFLAVSQTAGDPEPEVHREEVLTEAEAWS